MTKGFARIAVLLVLALGAGPVLACRCLEPASTAVAYGRAHAVVRAAVLSVDGVGDSPGGARARLRVEEAWKADVAGEIVVSTSTTCAFDFQPGNEYLLYLYPGPGAGEWTTRICMGNCLTANAERALRWLRAHGRKTQVQPLREQAGPAAG
jgi:hypothetical protein